jgi:hypothetical protein
MIRYVVHGGEVVAKDGDRHFIGFLDLCMLYLVSPRECLYDNPNEPYKFKGYADDYLASLTHLYTRSDGKYARPEAVQESA